MRCLLTSELANWLRVTGVNRDLVAELVASGLEAHEARWLVEEFVSDGDLGDLSALRAAAQRCREGEPIQYVIGHWPFRSLDLDVDARVLIPRPESEELVGVALNELATRNVRAPVIMDLGCGSGAIGLALISELSERGVAASLIAIDETSDSLDVARQNAIKHEIHAVSFVQSSWFEDLDQSFLGRVDLIVANPPYVGALEFEDLDDVLRYEPFGAMVAPDAHGIVGFEDLDVIISGALDWLSPSGTLICEHSNVHGTAVLDAATRAGFNSVQDIEDMAGHPRILVARRA
jgi:release factor glutamine methyltransferase